MQSMSFNPYLTHTFLKSSQFMGLSLNFKNCKIFQHKLQDNEFELSNFFVSIIIFVNSLRISVYTLFTGLFEARVSLYRLNWTETHSVCLYLPVLGLRVCANHSSFILPLTPRFVLPFVSNFMSNLCYPSMHGC